MLVSSRSCPCLRAYSLLTHARCALHIRGGARPPVVQDLAERGTGILRQTTHGVEQGDTKVAPSWQRAIGLERDTRIQ